MWVFSKTLVRKFPISYSHTEGTLFFHEGTFWQIRESPVKANNDINNNNNHNNDNHLYKSSIIIFFCDEGMRVSFISIGGACFGNMYGSMAEEESITTIRAGLKMGLNYIDTSPWYGKRISEQIIGKVCSSILLSMCVLKVNAFYHSCSETDSTIKK